VIIFDSTYLVVYLNPNPPAAADREGKPVEQFKERVANLAGKLDASNQVIGVPAPAMAEVLVRAGKGRAQLVSILSDRWHFQILPFDSRAAIEASELIAAVKSNKERWDTWAKVKFDIQIVAVAKAEAASIIYTDDKYIENLAKRVKIPVMRICDLPLPLPPEPTPIDATPVGVQMDLLPNTRAIELRDEEDASKTAAPVPEPRAAEANNKLQADPAHPAHPPSAQGSDSGRDQGEAAGEEKAGKG
jgi:predicted nucleic acid-binding protein